MACVQLSGLATQLPLYSACTAQLRLSELAHRNVRRRILNNSILLMWHLACYTNTFFITESTTRTPKCSMTSRISHHGHLGHLGHLGHDHDRTGDPPSVTESDRTAPGGSGQVRSWSCQRWKDLGSCEGRRRCLNVYVT